MSESINQVRAAHELDAVASGQVQEMLETIANASPNFSIDEIPNEQQRSALFDSLCERGQIRVATGFTEGEIQGFFQMIHPHCVLAWQAGARPRSSWLDMVVCYLAWAKLGVDYLKLSVILGGISASRL